MANTFKLKTKASVGVTTTGVYVVPASTTTVVIGITASNVSGNNINVGIGITRAAADDVLTVDKGDYTFTATPVSAPASVDDATALAIALG